MGQNFQRFLSSKNRENGGSKLQKKANLTKILNGEIQGREIVKLAVVFCELGRLASPKIFFEPVATGVTAHIGLEDPGIISSWSERVSKEGEERSIGEGEESEKREKDGEEPRI